MVATNRQDRATLDGKPVTGRPMERISALLDIRELADISAPAEVTSLNTVPTAAGLASSASGFAALAGAAAAAAVWISARRSSPDWLGAGLAQRPAQFSVAWPSGMPDTMTNPPTRSRWKLE